MSHCNWLVEQFWHYTFAQLNQVTRNTFSQTNIPNCIVNYAIAQHNLNAICLRIYPIPIALNQSHLHINQSCIDKFTIMFIVMKVCRAVVFNQRTPLLILRGERTTIFTHAERYLHIHTFFWHHECSLHICWHIFYLCNAMHCNSLGA